MLIDAHLHVWRREMRTDPCVQVMAFRMSRRSLPFGNPEELITEGKVGYWDPGAEKWVKDMEYVGVDAGVNLPTDFGNVEGCFGEDAPLSIEEINREYCDWVKKYPGKFFTFIGVNPRRRNAVDLLEKGVKEWGGLGLKLLPQTGFYPDDRVCYRLYEKCAELGVPVCIHTGAAFLGYSKYAQPVYLEKPAKDFPELDFIMAHAGGGIGHLWEEACTVARFLPNLHLELAQFAPTVIKGGFLGNKGKFKDHTPQFIDILDIMRNTLTGGCLNMIFGSDYPTYPIEVYKEWCDLFKNLPAIAARYGYDFSQEEADLMCYKNAIRIMKLDVPEI